MKRSINENIHAPVEADWKKQALQALVVFLLTYISAAIILGLNKGGNVFTLALLPTLATLYSNIGLIRKIVHKIIRR